MQLPNHVALITGGAGAVGRAVFRRFMDAGARVCVVDRDEEAVRKLREETSGEGNRCSVVVGDVLDEIGLEGIFKHSESIVGPIDTLVNAVGGIGVLSSIPETETAEFERLIDLNLKSAFIASKVAMKFMLPRKNGRIISLGVLPAAGRGAYSIAKAGVIALTEVLAEEGREHGITANCVVPSHVRTAPNSEGHKAERIGDWVPLEELARTFAFLASDAASSINGTVIKVYGKL
jgi:NAD(P)-dependent dehydrogenase (short-subunit alcohol dehydrogenase family)